MRSEMVDTPTAEKIDMVEEEIKPTGDGASEERQEPAGLRELDYAVAERVMGWRWWRTTLRYSTEVRRALMQADLQNDEWQLADGTEDVFTGEHSPFVSRYSTSIAAAMEIVEKLGADGYSFACTIYQGHLPYASFCKGTAASSKNAEADTLPEAICRAALALVDGNQEGKQ